ncbi:hypothetical protein COOONC_09605 [Cooperia oncophora]
MRVARLQMKMALAHILRAVRDASRGSVGELCNYLESGIHDDANSMLAGFKWSSRSRANEDPLTFLPFGYGPRNCIGMRVARLQMKMALAHILRAYEMRPGEVLVSYAIIWNLAYMMTQIVCLLGSSQSHALLFKANR